MLSRNRIAITGSVYEPKRLWRSGENELEGIKNACGNVSTLFFSLRNEPVVEANARSDSEWGSLGFSTLRQYWTLAIVGYFADKLAVDLIQPVSIKIHTL